MYMGFNMFYLEPNEHRYLTPREQYDRAIINDAGERCIYDEKQVLSILTADYRPVSYTHLTLPTNREV